MFDNLDDPRQQALLAAAFGLLGGQGGKGFGGFARDAGQAGLLGLNRYAAASQDKRRNEQADMQAKLQAIQLASAQREQDYLQARASGVQPGPVQSQTFAPTDYETPSQVTRGPDTFSWSKAMAVDPFRARMEQAQMASLTNKQLHNVKPGETLGLFDAEKGTFNQLYKGEQEKPTQVKELEYALDQMGIKPGTPAHQAAIQTFLTKTSGGLDVYKAKLEAVNAGVKIAEARDQGVGGLPGLPSFPGFITGGVSGPISRPPMASPQPGPQNAPMAPVAAPGVVPSQVPLGLSPKDARGVAKVIFEDAEKAKAQAGRDLPQVVSENSRTSSMISDLVNHPGMRDAVGKGKTGGAVLNNLPFVNNAYMPGTDAADFKARLDQLNGQSFLSAYQKLKGGGAITEIEGKKATDAINRMKTSQSEAEFVGAAAELDGMLNQAVNLAKQKAGVKSTGGWSIQRVQ